MRICEKCGHILENGEQYADLGGEIYCRDCLHDMSVDDLMDLVGFPMRTMFGSSAIDIDDEDYVALMRSIKGGQRNGYQTA